MSSDLFLCRNFGAYHALPCELYDDATLLKKRWHKPRSNGYSKWPGILGMDEETILTHDTSAKKSAVRKSTNPHLDSRLELLAA